MAEQIMVVGCSPRKDGNSDKAAREVDGTLKELGFDPELVFLRDKKILPCMGCRSCENTKKNRCILAEKDDVQELLHKMQEVQGIYFCSPIYYYHVPAGFKALIDRGQSFYEAWMQGEQAPQAGKKAFCILIAGRKKGELLFQGSLITMKYFLQPLGYSLDDLCLRGLDSKQDLATDAGSLEQIRTFVREGAW